MKVERQAARQCDDTHQAEQPPGTGLDFVELAGAEPHLHVARQGLEYFCSRPARPVQIEQDRHVVADDPRCIVEALHRILHVAARQCGHQVAAMADRVGFFGNPASIADDFERFVGRRERIGDQAFRGTCELGLQRPEPAIAQPELLRLQRDRRQCARVDLPFLQRRLFSSSPGSTSLSISMTMARSDENS